VQKSSDRRAGSDGVLHANCPAKSYYFPATREAGLVQIAESLADRGPRTLSLARSELLVNARCWKDLVYRRYGRNGWR
jgi:hypothetical protein